MPTWLSDALRSPESSGLMMLSTVVLWILSLIRKAQKMAKDDEKAMLSVPPTQALPAPSDQSLRQRVEELEQRLRNATWREDELLAKLSSARRDVNDTALDLAKTAASLASERAAHDETREEAKRYRAHAMALSEELRERMRSADSGYTRLPDMRPPEQISEEDASPTPRPRRRGER
jgi:septal ring factor EnvC (AmiA/AmiB activator)